MQGEGVRLMRIVGYCSWAVVVLALALPGAALARATETTRPEYVAQVEPICKANTKANERILSGVKTEVKKNDLKPAAAQLSKASGALKETLAELWAVPQPPADRARLGRWLGYVKTEAELFQSAAKKLKENNKFGTQAMALRLNNDATLANNTVLEFDFHYCRFEPARFL
jgi:hypothetical protein